MNFASRHPIAAIVCFAGASLAAPSAFAQAPAAPLPIDFQALDRGKVAISQEQYADAIKIIEDLLKSYPQSPTVPEATFQLGLAYYLSGDFDKAVENMQKVPLAKGAAPEIIELAMSVAPQVLSAKATKLDAKDPGRTKAYENAIAQFDVFIQKFPQSDEVETANYGKALANFQVQRYEEAAAPLRANLQKFAKSDSIQDTQFLLSLVLANQAVDELQKGPAPAAMGKFDESEKQLRDIVAKKTNVAMVNDAQFQLGEVLSTRAAFVDGEKEKPQREAIFQKALDAYRTVISKEQVVAAQKAWVAGIQAKRLEALRAQNFPLVKKLDSMGIKEQTKLKTFEQRADQTIMAKLKSAQIFFQQNKIDETRVLLNYVEPFAETDDTKKQTLYYLTMTYALQSLMERAEERYNTFQAAYKGDDIAQNLQLVMAAGFLSNKDVKLQSPEKAIDYCKQGLQLYPKGRFTSDLLNMEAGALIALKRYDEALDLLKKFIASNPAKDLAADAEYNLGTIYKDTGKTAEALKTFAGIREKYPEMRQAEQAWYWLVELNLLADPKAAVTEGKAFAAKYPTSTLLPGVLFTLGRAQAATNAGDDAIATFTELHKTYPKSDAAAFGYFERAKIVNGRQQPDECIALMKEFVTEYPESPRVYDAYDFMAQILESQSKRAEAIEAYDEYLQKRPDEPSAATALLKVNGLWKKVADSQGPVLAQDEKKRADWTKGVQNATAAAEKIVEKFPESPELALALSNLLELQKSKVIAKLATDADIEKYFEGLAAKAEGKDAAQSKIHFTLAAFLAQKDKPKAAKLMSDTYKPDLKYAPEDIDLYGQLMLDAKDYDKALQVYQKLAKDYPVGSDPKKSPRQNQEAMAIALAGEGKALQGKGDKEGGAARFKELETNYPWSPKMMEVNYGIAVGLHEKKQDDDAMKRLLEVVKTSTASSSLRANSMLLIGNIHEDAGRFDAAIDNYIRIATFYAGVPEVAAEGLWRGAQLLERQARGELPMPTPPPKTAAGAAKP